MFIGAFTLTRITGIGAGISQYIDGQVNNIGAKNVLIVSAKTAASTSATTTDPQKYDPEKVTAQQGRGGPARGETVTLLTTKGIETLTSEAGIIDVTPKRSVTPCNIVGVNGQKYVLAVSGYLNGTNVAMNSGTITYSSATNRQVLLSYSYVSVLGYSDYLDVVGKYVSMGISDAKCIVSEVLATITGVPQKSLVAGTGATVNIALFYALYAA